jgi:endonuclease III
MSKSEKPSKNPLTADLMKACEKLEERYGRRKQPKIPDFIEALMTQILELGTSEKASKDAMARLKAEYVDWNDMRVATVREIEDILGDKYDRCREKAEDIKHLLADLYTAFRRMEINDLLTPEGIQTLRALPDTTNIRRDMVDRALVLALDVKVFPCDEAQFRLLKFLGGVPKHANLENFHKKIDEALEVEDILRLSRVLREHVNTCALAGESEPQAVDFGAKKPGTSKTVKDKTTKRLKK